MPYEYKCVGAPERARRRKGARTRSDRVARAMEDLINDNAIDGWEYLRTDLVPVEEKGGVLSRSQEVHRAVLIFRREILRLSGHEAASPGTTADALLTAEPDPSQRARRTPTGLS